MLSLFARAALSLDIRDADLGQAREAHAWNPQELVMFLTPVGTQSNLPLHPKARELADLPAFRRLPTLAHACRFAVRRALVQAGKGSLPSTIRQLPVSGVLKKFLDLQC